ncbi:MAG TPA: UDP-glucose 4-epimerase [Clostridiales bacterium]|nr:UDP-glucose 4-epimerase [Clostridiales bacterium]
MKCLVTGGAGFIGSHLVDALVDKGEEVHVVDDLSTGRQENLHPAAFFHKIDVCDPVLSKLICSIRPEVVFHLAAQVSVPHSVENPYEDTRVNVLGTVNLLEACVQAGVKRVIFSSSAAVYGIPQYLPIDEEHPLLTISPYGTSKVAAEKYLQLYNRIYGLEYVILRYANVFGPRQDADGEGGVVSIFAQAVHNRLPLKIYDDGEQTRDFVYVKDIVRANLAALLCASAITINVSTESATSVNQLANLINRIVNSSNPIKYEPERPGDIRHSILCNNRAKKELHWEPVYTLEEGLNDMLE